MWSLECRYELYLQECLLIKERLVLHPLEVRAIYVMAAFRQGGSARMFCL